MGALELFTLAYSVRHLLVREQIGFCTERSIAQVAHMHTTTMDAFNVIFKILRRRVRLGAPNDVALIRLRVHPLGAFMNFAHVT